jgi:hypothetical protein
MREWIVQHHSRLGLGKGMRRQTTVVEPVRAPVGPVREVVAEIMPAEPVKALIDVLTDAPDDDKGTLQRLEQAERIAYKRFIDSGGSERAGQLWLLCADQLRKTRDSSAKLANDVSEAETKFCGTCAEVILELKNYLEAMPDLLGILCEGLKREQIAAKAKDQIRRTLQHAAESLASQLKGTSSKFG